MITRYVVIAGLILAGLSQPTYARSKAAAYLLQQEVGKACQGNGGTATADAIVERDLTGDGRADLIIDHGGIACRSGARSGFCGIRACTVLIYVRRGKLLKLSHEVLSIGVSVGGGSRPQIELIGHNFGKSSIRWNGSAFR